MKIASFLPPEVVAVLESGRTIEAIKLLRQLRGLGLAEATSLVNQYLAATKAAASALSIPSSPSSAPPEVSLPAQVIAALQGGNKIEAIRLARELRGLGLREAKLAVEAWEARSKGVMTNPGLAPGEQKRSSSLLWLIIFAVVVAYVLYRFFGAGG